MAQKKTQGGSSTSTNPKLDPNMPTNTKKEPDEWVSGDDPMTGAQASYERHSVKKLVILMRMIRTSRRQRHRNVLML